MCIALLDRRSIDWLYELTRIDRWFLSKMKNIVDMYTKLKTMGGSLDRLTQTDLLLAKQMGFSDEQVRTKITFFEFRDVTSIVRAVFNYISIADRCHLGDVGHGDP